MITADSRLTDIFKNHKETFSVFQKYGLACQGCKGQAEDTVAKVVVNNGLDLKTFLEELNAAK